MVLSCFYRNIPDSEPEGLNIQVFYLQIYTKYFKYFQHYNSMWILCINVIRSGDYG